MNLLTKPILYGVTLLLALSLLWGGFQWADKQQARTEASEAREALANYKAEAEMAMSRYLEQARAQEHRHASDMERIAIEHQESLTNAQVKSDRLVADLRSGAIRLQDKWRGCVASTDVPDPLAGTREPDAAQRGREEGAARIIAAADACDAQVAGLQAVIRADRAKPSL